MKRTKYYSNIVVTFENIGVASNLMGLSNKGLTKCCKNNIIVNTAIHHKISRSNIYIYIKYLYLNKIK